MPFQVIRTGESTINKMFEGSLSFWGKGTKRIDIEGDISGDRVAAVFISIPIKNVGIEPVD
jgi:hypothetical protein